MKASMIRRESSKPAARARPRTLLLAVLSLHDGAVRRAL
jgi:hypothetical protein